MLNSFRFKKLKNGCREVFAVIDGKKAPAFVVFPDAFEKYKKESELRKFIERQGRSIAELYGGAPSRSVA